MKFRFVFLLTGLFTLSNLSAQELATPDWFHKDLEKDGIPGLSTDRAYKELLKDRKGQTVIVAVIDSGVDYLHEDLKNIMWVNEDEIPDNGIDDDNNGYIDDIHGWNFLGNKDGTNIRYENLEMTRLYVKYKKKYENKKPEELSKKEKKEFENYIKWGEIIESKKEELSPNVSLYGGTLAAFMAFEKAIGKERSEITKEAVEAFKPEEDIMQRVKDVVKQILDDGENFESYMEGLEEAFEYYYSNLNFHYNPEFDAREVVGDNIKDPYEKGYGNNDVKGPDAEHGTHVAGVIAAQRGNDLGIDGVASNVRIMSLRTVPNGDERDKDVANAILYAVENGASVINMSFGKGASPYKDVVDKAVKYALKKDVVLIHGAGNDNKLVDLDNNFPNDRFRKKGLFGPRYADNWIEVGANTWLKDENITAEFSNFSSKNVDVFAPGVEIYSTVPESKYKNLQGTSMAAPMVAGVAAMLRSYFPKLTAKQVKNIIMETVVRHKGAVKKPGTDELVSFRQLSVTGGIVNAYKAVELAIQTKGKKKVKKNKKPRA